MKKKLPRNKLIYDSLKGKNNLNKGHEIDSEFDKAKYDRKTLKRQFEELIDDELSESQKNEDHL